MNKDIENILRKLYDKYSTDFSKEDIKSILAFDDTLIDTPLSVGKRLSIEYVGFQGIKKDGEIIDFKKTFSNGINLIVADNLKGKSSLFKIIKTALVGDDNYIKPDVRQWISSIKLGFKINDKSYCILMNTEKRIKSKLYNCSYEELINGDEISDRVIFQANSNAEHANEMQIFFFNQFSYFSMKWTQKTSSKDSHELVEAGTSWKTYFKSIYLESRDSNSFYGGQEQKTFQMLLSLEYTKYINILTVKKEKLQSELAKEEGFIEHKKDNVRFNELTSELKSINEQLISLKNTEDILKLNGLKEQRNQLRKKIRNSNDSLAEYYKNIKVYVLNKDVIEKEIIENESEYKRISKEIVKSTRLINDIKEYLEVGQFFSALEITFCPSCNHQVTRISKEDSHVCPLCHEEAVNNEGEEKEKYIEKVDELKSLIQKFEKEQELLTFKKKELSEKWEKIEKTVQDYSLQISILEESSTEVSLESLNQLIEDLENETDDVQGKEKELIAKQAVLNYQLDQRNNEGSENTRIQELKKTILLLEDSICELDNLRFSRSQNILDELKKTMLLAIHDFGLKSIVDINIDNKFNITYTQNDVKVKFSEIAEGEQLRVKLAFYLSLIQLDIDKNYGRHTRLLIIDSPNKEEGDTAYLEGFKEILSVINRKYKNNLQIIIGTATRDFIGTVENEKIYLEGEYLF